MTADQPARVIDLAARRRARVLANTPVVRLSDKTVSLNAQIAAAPSAAAVLDAVSAAFALAPAGARMHSGSLAAALTRVLQLAREGGDAAWLLRDPRFVQLCDAHAQQLRFMTAEHLVEVLLAFGKAGVQPPSLWMKTFLHATLPLLQTLGPRHLSGVLHSLALLDHAPFERWLQSFWSAHKSQSFMPQYMFDLSSIMRSCGQLQLRPPDDFLSSFWLMNEQALPRMRGPGTAMIMHTHGKLNLKPPDSWQEQYWTVTESALADFEPRSLVTTFRACALLGIMPPQAWMTAFWAAVEGQLSTFVDRDWCVRVMNIAARLRFANHLSILQFDRASLLDACACLELTPPAGVVSEFTSTTSGGAAARFSASSLVYIVHACARLGIAPPVGWEGISAAALPLLNPSQLLLLLKSFAALGVKPAINFWQRYWMVTTRLLPQFDKDVLVQTRDAYRHIDHGFALSHGNWLEQFWRSSPPALANARSTNTLLGLTNTLAAVVDTLELQPPEAWFRAFTDVSVPLLAQESAAGLVNLLLEMRTAKVAQVLPEQYLKQYWAALAPKLTELNHPAELAFLMHTCACLSITPPAAFLKLYMEQCTQTLKVAPQHLTRMLCALAALRLWDAPQLASIFAALADVFVAKASNAQDLYAVYLLASVERPGLIVTPSAAFMEAAEQKWRAHQDNRLARGTTVRDDVCATLERMGVQHEAAGWCDRSKQYVEVAVTSTDPPVALLLPRELLPSGQDPYADEPPTPRTYTDEAPNPRTQLRLRMLAAHGWRPVSVKRWLVQDTPEQKEELLRSAMAAERPPML
jgi:hypothetical protein